MIFSLDEIQRVLRADGTVLIPVDTAGRVLELILILEQVKGVIFSFCINLKFKDSFMRF